MSEFPRRKPSLAEEGYIQRMKDCALDHFVGAFAERGLDRMIIDGYLEDGCTIEDLQTLFKTLPEFGAQREREDVYTRGELVMHTLARFVMHYANTDMVYETDPEKWLGPPEGRNPLTDEERIRLLDEQARFRHDSALLQNMQAVLITYFMQHVESEEHASRAMELLSQDGFRTHFARYLTALTRPDLLQRDRPGEKPLENSENLQEYRIYSSGVPLPPLSELEKAFSGANSVSWVFDGRPWQRHPSCKDVPGRPGESVMAVRIFNQEIRPERAIDEMKETHRSAVETEARDLSLSYPDLQKKCFLLACGSFAVDGGRRYVAVLYSGSGGGRRIFDRYWFDRGWSSGGRFLFVRK